jgi:DNA-binding CsgD family transcriptional regulator/PAS domain-containing protein
VLEQFSATIEKIYSAAAGAIAWREALIAIEDLTGSAGAVIDLVPKVQSEPRKTLAGSFTEENCADYARDYQAVCPRIRHALQHPDLQTQFDYQFMTESGMDRDPVYHWFGTHGLRYYIGSAVAATPNYLAFVSLQRTRRQGHVGAGDVELFDLLKPHLAKAASLADQLGTLRDSDRLSSMLLEGLPQAVFALGADGVVLFANLRAERMLLDGDGLRVEGGRLTAATGDDQQLLDTMITSAMNPLSRPLGGWATLHRPSGRRPLAVYVSALPRDSGFLGPSAKVLLLVHDPAERCCVDIAMLTSMYGMTQTEARLASALSGGHSIESAAAMLHMQPATARSHLKSIFRKAGVGRQQDLVRLLTSLSTFPPLRTA